MGRIKTASAARIDRHRRLRQRVVGTTKRPRLCVFRSSRHMYAQVIDDARGHTVATASTLELALHEQVAGMAKTAIAHQVGKLVAKRAKAVGVIKVVFDRGGFQYHGRVKELANGARQEGLEF